LNIIAYISRFAYTLGANLPESFKRFRNVKNKERPSARGHAGVAFGKVICGIMRVFLECV
jgi:hypothetical protein